MVGAPAFMESPALAAVPAINVSMSSPSPGPCGQNPVFMDLFCSRDRWPASNAFAIALPLLMCPLHPSPGSPELWGKCVFHPNQALFHIVLQGLAGWI